jgi:glutaredoxin-related protein
MADDALTKIDGEVKKNKVLIFMKGNPKFPQCGFSDATVRLIESFGYPFETVDVLADPQVREGQRSRKSISMESSSEAATLSVRCTSGVSWLRS